MNVQRFRGGPVFKAHRLCVSLNSRLESINEREKGGRHLDAPHDRAHLPRPPEQQRGTVTLQKWRVALHRKGELLYAGGTHDRLHEVHLPVWRVASLIGCTSCIVKSFRSRSSFISSPLCLSLRSDAISAIKILSCLTCGSVATSVRTVSGRARLGREQKSFM